MCGERDAGKDRRLARARHGREIERGIGRRAEEGRGAREEGRTSVLGVGSALTCWCACLSTGFLWYPLVGIAHGQFNGSVEIGGEAPVARRGCRRKQGTGM